MVKLKKSKKLKKLQKSKKSKKTKNKIYKGGYEFLSEDDKEYMDKVKNDFIDKYTSYGDSLIQYKLIIQSLKILLGLSPDEDIIDYTTDKIIQDDFFSIEDYLNGDIDGVQINYRNPNASINDDIVVKGINLKSKIQPNYQIWGITLAPVILNYETIYKDLIISHELSHLILINFLSLTLPKLLETSKSKGEYMFTNQENKCFTLQEIFCDLIAIAIIFIKFRITEPIDEITDMTSSEHQLINDMEKDKEPYFFVELWGDGDETHPNSSIRLDHSLLLLKSLSRIKDFDISNPDKIKKVRELVKEHMLDYLKKDCSKIYNNIYWAYPKIKN